MSRYEDEWPSVIAWVSTLTATRHTSIWKSLSTVINDVINDADRHAPHVHLEVVIDRY